MNQYKEGWELPNPFLNAEGKLVENLKEWKEQREYLKSLLIRYQYGTVPPAPPFYREEATGKKELLEGAGIEENIRLYFGPKGEITFRIIVLRPNDSEKHKTAIVPSYVNARAAEESIRAGYCVVVFDPTEPAPDDFDYKRGSCYQTYPEYTWKVIAMWAWLQSRTLDYLLMQPYVDSSCVISAGHSRYGKTALCCAVMDERFTICAATNRSIAYPHRFVKSFFQNGTYEIRHENRKSFLLFAVFPVQPLKPGSQPFRRSEKRDCRADRAEYDRRQDMRAV